MNHPIKFEPSVDLREILPVLVLYNCSLSKSSTYRSLCESLHHCGDMPNQLAVYDNSSVSEVSENERENLGAFCHDPSNGGLAAAYNWALNLATGHRATWLLLLDQDSAFPAQFMSELIKLAGQLKNNDRVAAVVPHVKGGDILISPSWVTLTRLRPIPISETGPQTRELTAINTGILVKTGFIHSIGGFNSMFRLDSLDHWLFQQIYSKGKIAVISSSVVAHDLSVLDYRSKITLARYKSILESEAALVRTFRSRAHTCVYAFKLLLRCAKQVLVYRRPEIASFTLRTLLKLIARPSHLAVGGRRKPASLGSERLT